MCSSDLLVVLGLGLLVARRAGAWARTVFVACAVLTAVSAAVALRFWFTSESTVRIYYGTDTRAAAILMGAALAAWMIWRGPARRDGARLALEAAGAFAVLILALCWWRLEGRALYAGGLLLCSACATVVIAAAAHPIPGPVARAFAWRPLVAAGLVSYGLYLWHWPVYVVLDARRTGLDPWPLLALRLAVTTAFALASYHYVEQPIRQRRWSTGTLRWLTPVSAALLVALAFVSTMREAPDRRIARVDAASASAAAARAATQVGTTRLMVVGNSIGWFLGDEGFEPRDAAANTTTLNAAFPACHFPTVDLERGAELGGGHAGHNGLRDIHAQLGTDQYWRLRLGIGHPGVKSEVANWVLRKPAPEQRDAIEACITRTTAALTPLLRGDWTRATQMVHTAKPPRPKPPRAALPPQGERDDLTSSSQNGPAAGADRATKPDA